MNEVVEFFGNLFSSSDWPPRWSCGKWSAFHGWLTILSDLTIWLAYFFIPVILIKFTQSKKDLPFLPIFWLFGAFIILCGFTHLMDAIIFWWPAYRFGTLVKFLTSVVSIATVIALLRFLPKMINYKNTDENKEQAVEQTHQLEEKVAQLSKEILRKENEIDAMKLEIAQLKNSM